MASTTRGIKRKLAEPEHENRRSTAGERGTPERKRGKIQRRLQQDSPLLKLPPELHNAIYRLSLVEAERITVVGGAARPPPEPALLQLCRQARKETTAIYYNENLFGIIISDCDASQYIKWCQSSVARFESNHEFANNRTHPSNWSNLLVWMEAYCRRKCSAPEPVKDQVKQGDDSAVIQLCWMVHRLKEEHKLSWKKIKQQLELVHPVMTALSAKWA